MGDGWALNLLFVTSELPYFLPKRRATKYYNAAIHKVQNKAFINNKPIAKSPPFFINVNG